MFTSSLLLAAAALTGIATAQNYSTSGNLTVVPDSVDLDTREAWCRAQTTSCPEICGGDATVNTCDSDDLTYVCTCSSGASPNISSYTQTLPFYECQQWIIDCVADHPNDLTGQTACMSVTCGTLNASDATASTSSSSSSSSVLSTTSSASTASSSGAAATSGSSTSGSATTTAASTSATSSASAAMAMKMAREYGTGALLAGMLAAFGLAL